MYKKASDVQVAVVGYGGAFNMGKKHLEECKSAGMTPTAVVDLDPARLSIAKTDFPGIETYDSVKEMLKSSSANFVIVITPHNTHAALATQCAKAGRHVVVEKPFAITTTECDKMIAAAKASNVLLSTYHNRHWDGCVLGAMKQVRKGVIGDVVRIDASMGRWAKPGDWWRSSRSISGGILFDWGVHLLEYSLQIIDSEIVEVTGFSTSGVWGSRTRWKDDANEDEATALVRFANGAFLSLRISSIEANPRPHVLEITGTDGTYSFNHSDYELVRPKASKTVREIGANPKSEQWRFYRNVADHLVKGEDLVITPEWARRPVHILDLAVRSAAQGKTLKAKYQ